MVKTRSITRKELEQKDTKDSASLPQDFKQQIDQPSLKTPGMGSIKSEQRLPVTPPAGTSQATAPPVPPQAPSKTKHKGSTASSVLARKKRLELEAAREKARIQMELIDKKLEADLADLEDEEYSPHNSEASEVDSQAKVEKWFERSEHEQERQHSPVDGNPLNNIPCAAGTSDETIKMLASALKDFATTTKNNGANGNLLSRISTPRDLPEFSGDPLEWLQFKQAYEESTQVCGFSPKENLWRLRKCLRGQAKDSVSALLISATSSELIMSTLALRFGNADTIINKLMQDVKKLQPLSPEYHTDIVIFSVKVQNFIAAVRAVGREEYLQGINAASIILSKLPPVLISKWSDYGFPLITEGKKSRLDILADFLNQEAIKISTTANVSLMSTRNNNNQPRSHTVLLQTARDDACQFCKISKHRLIDCKKFKKALRKERWRHVKRLGLCYKCLVSRHERDTCSEPLCDKDGCGEAHHRLLHFTANNNNTRAPEPQPGPEAATPEAETVTYVNTSDKKVLLKLVRIKIHGPNGVFSACALLDDGSTVSLISSALATRAGLRGRAETMRVCGAWNNTELVCKTTLVTVDISGVDGMDNKLYAISARSVNELNLPKQNACNLDYDKYAHLSKIKDKLCCVDQIKPEMLIGQDNFHLLQPLEVLVGNIYEPSATRTPLGWCLHGVVYMTAPRGPRAAPAARAAPASRAVLSLREARRAGAGACALDQGDPELRALHEEVRHSFAIDALGVSSKPRQNADDVRALALLEQSATFADGRWTVGLPWKDASRKLPDSYPAALTRLKGVERKMLANKEYAHRYEERVNHLLENDYAKEMKDAVDTLIKWYLPHFGVDNPYKEKLRLVFDAASKCKGFSLNDYLLTGPDLLASLFGIMVRFRENRVAVTGDIKDMFLRIKINPADQNALRFLWRGSGDTTAPVKTYAMTSLIFGANCSPFIAQFIKNKNASRFESTLGPAAAAVRAQHYMDDYIDSLPDEATAIQMVKDVTQIHSAGGFHIRNWTSNSPAVLDTIPIETLGDTAVRFKLGQQYEGERTLGLLWYPATDELGFDVSLKRVPEGIVRGLERPTKRLMLKVVMSIFDVFGFLAPFTIQGKIMLQDTWKSNIDWDDLIPDEMFVKWRQWLDLLKSINHVRILRCYHHASIGARGMACGSVAMGAPPPATGATPRVAATSASAAAQPASTSATTGNGSTSNYSSYYEDLQLHIFCDSSTKAMCTVAYWRWRNADKIFVAFVASKSRVAPVKPTTVPRLELQAALLAARLAHAVQHEHKIAPGLRHFWCDSTTVLHWIKNEARSYKAFVANRLGEIDELSRASEWRYIPTKLNVADAATREAYDSSVFENEWFKGPAFLYDDESEWPRDLVCDKIDKSDLECITLLHDASAGVPIPDISRFSSWLRLLRATAAVLKFINRCRKRRDAEIDCPTMERAEQLLLKHAQLESFGLEMTALSADKSISRSSRLVQLTPYLEEGVLRCGGRIDAARAVPACARRPVILDGAHALTRLLVRSYHEKAAHANQETVVNELKQKYYILRLRPTVKSVVSRCMFCRIKKAKPEVPKMGDLPEARLAHHQRPFTFCGLDLFGPMTVTVGRRHEHRYGVLFTCLTVRAIHVELVHSLTSDSLIMALRRMAARRGWPRHLYSDNGTNLRGADAELKRSLQELDEGTLQDQTVNYGVTWTFIPPASPHWGGAWERLIRSVKTTLKVVLKERTPRDEVLTTLMSEVENLVNGRPLTHVSVEPDSEETLTPNHFLLGSSSNMPVMGTFSDSEFHLRKQWRISQRLADMFWTRWVKEILPDLVPRKKWTQEHKALQVGDLVLIVDPAAQRNVWQKGVIEQVFPGRDGRVRVVQVKTKSGTLKRPAARVARVPLGDKC